MSFHVCLFILIFICFAALIVYYSLYVLQTLQDSCIFLNCLLNAINRFHFQVILTE